MTRLNMADKQRLMDDVHLYVNLGEKLSIRQYERIVRWLSGYTFREIAEMDEVSSQSVAFGVRRDLAKIIQFVAKHKDKQ